MNRIMSKKKSFEAVITGRAIEHENTKIIKIDIFT